MRRGDACLVCPIGRSPASASYRYKAGTHRLHQNLAEYDLECNLCMTRRFLKYFNGYKGVLSKRCTLFGKWQPRQLTNPVFLQQLYRYGEPAHADWSFINGFIGSDKTRKTAETKEFQTQLRKDFSSCVLQPGHIYTVACDGGAPPPPGFSTLADSHALVPIEKHVAAFEVLDRNVHLTKTTKKPELRGLFCPAVVQACYVVCGVPDDGATEILVHHFNESPEICDFSGLGTMRKSWVDGGALQPAVCGTRVSAVVWPPGMENDDSVALGTFNLPGCIDD